MVALAKRLAGGAHAVVVAGDAGLEALSHTVARKGGCKQSLLFEKNAEIGEGTTI